MMLGRNQEGNMWIMTDTGWKLLTQPKITCIAPTHTPTLLERLGIPPYDTSEAYCARIDAWLAECKKQREGRAA